MNQANRNQRKNQQRKTPQASHGAGAGRRQFLHPEAGPFVSNFLDDLAGILKKAHLTPLQSLYALASFCSSLVAIYGLWGSDAPTTYSPGSSSQLLNEFPIQVLIFLFLSAAIAGTVSTFSIFLTIRQNDLQKLANQGIAIAGGLFLASCTGWIFRDQIDKKPFLVFLFSVLGVAIAVHLVKWNFQQTLEPDRRINLDRATILMLFVCVTSLVVLFDQFIINDLFRF